MLSQKEISRRYYLKHRTKILKKAKIYYILHRKEILERNTKYNKNHSKKLKKYNRKYNKIYYKTHKKILNYQRNKYFKKRKKQDIQFKLLCQLRTRISLALKGNPKLSTTIKIIGCSIFKFKQHLQRQFKKGMTWKNYGLYGWHIDHIIPCAKFDLSKPSEQKKCFHYINLQPLWAKENLTKNKF